MLSQQVDASATVWSPPEASNPSLQCVPPKNVATRCIPFLQHCSRGKENYPAKERLLASIACGDAESLVASAPGAQGVGLTREKKSAWYLLHAHNIIYRTCYRIIIRICTSNV